MKTYGAFLDTESADCVTKRSPARTWPGMNGAPAATWFDCLKDDTMSMVSPRITWISRPSRGAA